MLPYWTQFRPKSEITLLSYIISHVHYICIGGYPSSSLQTFNRDHCLYKSGCSFSQFLYLSSTVTTRPSFVPNRRPVSPVSFRQTAIPTLLYMPSHNENKLNYNEVLLHPHHRRHFLRQHPRRRRSLRVKPLRMTL